jgi:type IV fimbrial biogenesis protein FimT
LAHGRGTRPGGSVAGVGREADMPVARAEAPSPPFLPAGGTGKRSSGITLLELLIAMTLVAIILGAGAPSFREIALNARRAEQVNALLRGLHAARSTAILRAEPVVLCKTGGGSQCLTDARAWSDGWLMFANRDRDSPPHIDPGESVLAIQPPSERIVVRANRNAITYWPFALAGTTVSFVFCDERGQGAARAIIVSQTGRPRVSNRDAAGRPLSCE